MVLNKYLECPNYGFKLENISTDKEEGEEISQAQMPCPECNQSMNMHIKINKGTTD